MTKKKPVKKIVNVKKTIVKPVASPIPEQSYDDGINDGFWRGVAAGALLVVGVHLIIYFIG